jgi:hypothetical protein
MWADIGKLEKSKINTGNQKYNWNEQCFDDYISRLDLTKEGISELENKPTKPS